MPELENPQHEMFAWLVAHDVPLPVAYRKVGFRADGFNASNWNRLARRPDVKVRIQEIRDQRELVAAAARMAPAEMIETLRRHGIERVTDFFELNGGGDLQAKNLRTVSVECATAFVRTLRKAMALPIGFERVGPGRIIADSGIIDWDAGSRLDDLANGAQFIPLPDASIERNTS
jgi:hypothetical protein